jgi:hypothetical protein
MSSLAFLKILGVADVERVIGAAEYVNPCHMTTMPSSWGLSNGLGEVAPRLASLARGTRPDTGLPRASPPARRRRARGRVEWCERRDSNSHGLATASPSSWPESEPIEADLGKPGSAFLCRSGLRPLVAAFHDFRCTLVAHGSCFPFTQRRHRVCCRPRGVDIEVGDMER